MSKTITLKISKEKYHTLKRMAQLDNRPMDNFIETAVERYIENRTFADEFEMTEIRNNTELNKSLKKAYGDIKKRNGKLVE
jgi:hypothetical protein